ncbi:MAG: hypothetical protein RLZZ241_1215 [Bacteroidota bacterium]|jgi:hypothetical protein
MGRFSRLRKNKKYDYHPRFYDNQGQGSPFKIEHKLDQFRTTAEGPGGLKTRWNRALGDLRQEGDTQQRYRFLIILAILIFIALFILDFDLSIFFKD